MNILVLGSGAREHSICWAVKKSKSCEKLFCSPGNAGIQKIAQCEFINLKKKIQILDFCKNNSIDLVIIGPEEYLADGVSDYLQNRGIKTFGPVKKAAKLETSKSFAKSFLLKNKILTPDLLNQETPKFLHRFSWLEDNEIGSLPLEYNCLVGWYKEPADGKPKILHYTEGGPWFDGYRDCEYADVWKKELNEGKFKKVF